MLVVSDSSSLILATKAGLLKLICVEFAVEIPPTVFEETVVAGKLLNKLDAWKIEEAIGARQIKVMPVNSNPNPKTLKWFEEFRLGAGEQEAIQLYLQGQADILLVDDRQAIHAAKLLNIAWVSLPVLLAGMAERQKLPLGEAMEKLRIIQEQGRYRLEFIIEIFNRLEKLRGEK